MADSRRWASPYSYGSGRPRTPDVRRSSQTLPQNHRIQSQRVISSSIVRESQHSKPPEETIKYVEVPVIEEIVTHVPKIEYVEVETRIPKYEYEWVERIVEVPQYETISKQVEVPQINEIIRHVPVKQVIDVPKEVIKYVPKIETRVVEKDVEVPGELIEVPMPYTVENRVLVPRYTNREVPTVVSQILQPEVSENPSDRMTVPLREYEPYVVPVDVYIPRPVARPLKPAGKEENHRVVDVAPAQYNALVKNLNPHLTEKDTDDLFQRAEDGKVHVLQGSGGNLVPPISLDWASGSSVTATS